MSEKHIFKRILPDPEGNDVVIEETEEVCEINGVKLRHLNMDGEEKPLNQSIPA